MFVVCGFLLEITSPGVYSFCEIIQMAVPQCTGLCVEQNIIATTTSSRGGIMEREGVRIRRRGNAFAFRFILVDV